MLGLLREGELLLVLVLLVILIVRLWLMWHVAVLLL
jgi:hypothetical protein